MAGLRHWLWVLVQSVVRATREATGWRSCGLCTLPGSSLDVWSVIAETWAVMGELSVRGQRCPWRSWGFVQCQAGGLISEPAGLFL